MEHLGCIDPVLVLCDRSINGGPVEEEYRFLSGNELSACQRNFTSWHGRCIFVREQADARMGFVSGRFV